MRLPKPGEIWTDTTGGWFRKVRILKPTEASFVRFRTIGKLPKDTDEWCLNDFLRDATIDETRTVIETLRKYERGH